MDTITLQEIVETNLKGITLDIFYLLTTCTETGISKKDIQQALYESEGGTGEVPNQKYRFTINDALSKLEGAMLVESYRIKQNQEQFFLTNYGQAAQKILEDYIDQNPQLIRSTVIIKNLNSENSEG